MLYLYVALFLPFSKLKLGCEDTPSWDDGHGNDCNLYAAQPSKCTEYPEDYNRPDLNCCVCSKDVK